MLVLRALPANRKRTQHNPQADNYTGILFLRSPELCATRRLYKCMCVCVCMSAHGKPHNLPNANTHICLFACVYIYVCKRAQECRRECVGYALASCRGAAEINYFSKQNMAKVGASKVVPLVVAAPSLSRAHSCLHLLLLLPALTWPKGYK